MEEGEWQVSLVANIKGPVGPPGANGAAGSAWHNGSGPPDDSFGVDGDYYLDDASGDVYVKVSGTWA